MPALCKKKLPLPQIEKMDIGCKSVSIMIGSYLQLLYNGNFLIEISYGYTHDFASTMQ